MPKFINMPKFMPRDEVEKELVNDVTAENENENEQEGEQQDV